MKQIVAITATELKHYFFSPIAYVFITVFLVVANWLFFNTFFIQGQASLRIFFGWAPMLFLVFVPAVAMGRWAEERKTGTIEILLTLPITDTQAVLGKFMAGLALLAITILLTLPIAVTVALVGTLDWGPVIGGYTGLLLLGATELALGLFLSSLTANQIIAFILTLVILFALYLIGEPLVLGLAPDFLVPIFSYLSLNSHFESIVRGVIDSRDVTFYALITSLFLYFNVLSVGARRWR